MDYLFIDESGNFEKLNDRGRSSSPSRKTMVGGIMTTTPPKVIYKKICELAQELLGDPKAKLHATEIKSTSREDSRKILHEKTLDLLSELEDVRLISNYYIKDTDTEIRILSDDFFVNRYINMVNGIIETALLNQPWAGKNNMTVVASERSLPVNQMSKKMKESKYLTFYVNKTVKMAKVFNSDYLAQICRQYIGENKNDTCFGRKFTQAFCYTQSEGYHGYNDEEQKYRVAGLVLADLVCDLLQNRELHTPELKKFRVLEIENNDNFRRYKDFTRSIHKNPSQLHELSNWVYYELPKQSKIRKYSNDLLETYIKNNIDKKREHILQAVKYDLDTKAGSFPLCDLVFNKFKLSEPKDYTFKSLKEWGIWLNWYNHSGSSRGKDIVPLLSKAFVDVLDQDIDYAISLAPKDIAALMVSFQDIFEYDQAIELGEDFFKRAKAIFSNFGNENSTPKWEGLGHLAGALAQTYCYCGNEKALARAREIFLRIPNLYHDDSIANHSQLAVHTANLAIMIKDEDLFIDMLKKLKIPTTAKDLASFILDFNPVSQSEFSKYFTIVVLTRIMVLQPFKLAKDLRSIITEPRNWNNLSTSILSKEGDWLRHPLEIIARHLIEIAPQGNVSKIVSLLDYSLKAFDDEGKIVSLLQFTTICACAIKLIDLNKNDIANECVNRGLSKYASYLNDEALFSSQIKTLKSDINIKTLKAFLDTVKYEYR